MDAQSYACGATFGYLGSCLSPDLSAERGGYGGSTAGHTQGACAANGVAQAGVWKFFLSRLDCRTFEVFGSVTV